VINKINNKFKNKKIVLCHGVFDLIHIGHIKFLKKAKELGNFLIVSVTTDEYVNKGPGRPAFNTQQRMKFLSELKFVDYVCESSDFTAKKVIEKFKPKFYCKGIDYPLSKLKKDQNLKTEIKAVKKNNGKFIVIKEEKLSSSKLINDYSLQNLNNACKNYIKLVKKDISLTNIKNSIEKINKLKVLVLGEMIIDNYIFVDSVGKSGKEPILIYKKVKEKKFMGGSGYISNLVSSFAKSINLISVIGEKKEELGFIKNNLNKNIKFSYVAKKNSPTIVKSRYLDSYRNNKIMGIYKLNDSMILKNEEKKYILKIRKQLKNSDLVIVADYGHGLFSKLIRDEIEKHKKKVYLNTQINSFNRGFHTLSNYKNINGLIINESELRHEMRDQNTKLEKLIQKLKKKIKFKHLIVTRGRYGSTHFVDKKKYLCPAFNENALDTTGAGDTFFALASLGLATKIDYKIVHLFSSMAAGYAVTNLSNKNYYNLSLLSKHINHMFQ
tara:strand:+ start:389 stop:1876 length:1488 start_codon:yes stop_codon:yes gene_type:complete